MQDGQQESGGLAAARGCAGEQVAALEREGTGFRRNGRGVDETGALARRRVGCSLRAKKLKDWSTDWVAQLDVRKVRLDRLAQGSGRATGPGVGARGGIPRTEGNRKAGQTNPTRPHHNPAQGRLRS